MSSEHPAVDSTLGGLYIGIVVGSALWGVTALQTWSYHREFPEDAWHLKLLIAVVFVLDTLHQIFISHTGYLYLVSSQSNPRVVEHIQWSFLVEVLAAGLVAVLVQGFFVSRIYRLSKKGIVLTLGLTVLVLGQFATCILFCAHSFNMKPLILKNLLFAINAMTVAADLAIACALCCLFHKSRTGVKTSDTIINRLIIFTVTTGLLTSLDAIGSLAAVAASPNTLIYMPFCFALCRLYVNSLLATLHARTRFRRDTAIASSLSMGDFVARPGVEFASNSALGKRSRPKSLTIMIDTTQEFRREGTVDSDTDSVTASTLTNEEAVDL
ncbi:hypothetical protein FA95DRAFT_166694 [Auriscalpium vulgare]|uniref:Uncharacterized protein n=1 Tax=Auriscalpium vulgare TaxID=40419 RepID=A0ACB8RNA5_9AGAM|nr:hypothetical protein FA95DRAFT_166694 [Auriscalpium vulgare]